MTTAAPATATVESAARVLDVLDLLFRCDYMAGLSPSEIAAELRITPASMTRYLATLRERYYRPATAPPSAGASTRPACCAPSTTPRGAPASYRVASRPPPTED